MYKIGYTFEYSFLFSQQQVVSFAEITGDNNPIHLDTEYAANSLFKKPIIHGYLGGSVFSKVFGTIFPGEGTIYLSQTMEFRRPMYVETRYKAIFTIVSVENEKKKAVINTYITDVNEKIVITGQAIIMHDTFINI